MESSHHSLNSGGAGAGRYGGGGGQQQQQPSTNMLDAYIRDLSIRRLVMAQQAGITGGDPAGAGLPPILNPMGMPGMSMGSVSAGGNGMANMGNSHHPALLAASRSAVAASALGQGGMMVPHQPSFSGAKGMPGTGGGMTSGGAGADIPHLADYAGTAADAFAQAFVDRWASIHSNGGGAGAAGPNTGAGVGGSYHSLPSEDQRWANGLQQASGSGAVNLPQPPPQAQDKPWFVCDFCKNKAFVSKTELKDHESVCEKNPVRIGLNMSGGGGARSAASGGMVNINNNAGGGDLPSVTVPRTNSDGASGSIGNSMHSLGNNMGPRPIPSIGGAMMPYGMNPYMAALSGGNHGDSSGMMMNQAHAHMMMMGMMPQLPGGFGGMGGIPSMAEAAAQSSEQVARRKREAVAIDPAVVEASKGPFRQIPKPMALSLDEDKDWLTALHCFVRKHCVEVFTATSQDVKTPSKGKRKPIQVGQVGIRCPHCHEGKIDTDPNRERGSVYYPAALSSIYNATMNLLQRHLNSCPKVPSHVMERYISLKKDDARSGTSKKYWVESAKSMGFVDTLQGIKVSAKQAPPPPSTSVSQNQMKEARGNDEDTSDYYDSDADVEDKEDEIEIDEGTKTSKDGEDDNDEEAEKGGNDNDDVNEDEDEDGEMKMKAAVSKDKEEEEEDADAGEKKKKKERRRKDPLADAPPLVTASDEATATPFSFLLLSQMQPCVFTEADRLGKRKGLPTGFAGLACRFCFGGYGSGRFFPSSIKTLSDTSKTLNVLHNHMSRCRKVPKDVFATLEAARLTHDDDRAKMKFGSQKAFFAKIWSRLHNNRPDGTVIKPPPRQTAASTGTQSNLKRLASGRDVHTNNPAMQRMGFGNGMMMPGGMMMPQMPHVMGGMPPNMMPYPMNPMMMMGGGGGRGFDQSQMMAQMMGGCPPGMVGGFAGMGGMGMNPHAMAQMMGGVGANQPQQVMSQQNNGSDSFGDNSRGSMGSSSSHSGERKKMKTTHTADV